MDKKVIIDHLNGIVAERIGEAQAEIDSINNSKKNETKSSAGDKYETGMAMLQIEEQKATVQLAKAKELKKTLSMIDLTEMHEKVGLGSLVQTSNGTYFISIGLGRIELEEKELFVLSISSPIGLQLKDKTRGESFQFMGRLIKIENIV